MLALSELFAPLTLSVLAGLSSNIGALLAFLSKKRIYIRSAIGFSAGVMLFVSFVKLLNRSMNSIGYPIAIIMFFLGIFLIAVIDFLVPHIHKGEGKNISELEKAGVLVALGLVIHKFPEGIAILFSSLVDIELGISIAVAVAIHNIPEGLAVAAPIYAATRKKGKALFYSLICSIAEPLGVLFGALFVFYFITAEILSLVLAAVAGVMVFISIDELLPLALKGEHPHIIIIDVFLGMFIMAVSMIFI